MPRDGSPPGGGADKPAGPIEPMSIGEVATPTYAVLPDPERVFAIRAQRFAALAPGHQLEGYLRLLAAVAQTQGAILRGLPPLAGPDAAQLTRAREHAMPPIPIAGLALDAVADATFAALLDGLQSHPDAATAGDVLEAVRAAPTGERRAMMQAILDDAVPEDAIAAHVLAAAALQVHLARSVATLDAASLQKIAPGACPACGGRPVASAVVNWPGAANTRYCTCSMCATQWNVARVTCLTCGAEKDIVYNSLEGAPDAVKAETCGGCGTYVKILYQTADPALDPVADDVATLGLDLLLREQGVTRASANAFLIGY